MARKRNEVETHVHITPAGLEALAKEIWGDAWRAKFSDVLGISYSQLHRYMTVYNGQRIPQVVVVALEGLRLLTTGTTNDTLVYIGTYRKPVADAVAVKFVQEKKERPGRATDPTPMVDFFGTDEPAEESDMVEAPGDHLPEAADLMAQTETAAPPVADPLPVAPIEDKPAPKAKPKRAALAKPAKAAAPAKPKDPAKPKAAAPAKAKKPAKGKAA